MPCSSTRDVTTRVCCGFPSRNDVIISDDAVSNVMTYTLEVFDVDFTDQSVYECEFDGTISQFHYLYVTGTKT